MRTICLPSSRNDALAGSETECPDWLCLDRLQQCQLNHPFLTILCRLTLVPVANKPSIPLI